MHGCRTHPNMHSNQTFFHTFKAVICNPINLSQFLTRSIVNDLCGFLKPSHCFIRLVPSNFVFEFVPSVQAMKPLTDLYLDISDLMS